MHQVPLAVEKTGDAIGGAFEVLTFERRVEIHRRDAAGTIRQLGVTFGVDRLALARRWVNVEVELIRSAATGSPMGGNSHDLAAEPGWFERITPEPAT